MKVLKKGKWSQEVTCKGCSSVLLVEADDIETGNYGSYGDYEAQYFVRCPECQERCVLRDSSVPEHAKAMARTKK